MIILYIGYKPGIAVIAVESAVKYSLVEKGIQTRRTGQYKAELTHSPRLCDKPADNCNNSYWNQFIIIVISC